MKTEIVQPKTVSIYTKNPCNINHVLDITMIQWLNEGYT